MDAQELFYNDVMTALSDSLDSDALQAVSKQLTAVMGKYDISRKCTELIVYERIPECVKIYLVTRKIEGLSMQTLKLYELRLSQFFNIVQKPIEQVTANDIRLFLYRMQEQSECTDRTLDGVRSIVSTFFKWANAEGYVSVNPCATIHPIKFTPKDRGYLSELEMELLRKACDNLRDKALIETLYSTGCRVSELVGLKISDVDFQKREVTLFGKGSKYRKAYINTRAEIAIRDYLNSRTDSTESLFVSRRQPYGNLTKEAVERVVRELGETAGITRRVFPHLIRHTTATLGLQRGMDITEIQRMLGHEKIETTLIYAKVADNSVKDSHRRYII